MSENDVDSLLLQKIGNGEERALVPLMERYKQPIFRFAYRYLGNEADSAEIAEDIFFRVYQNASKYSPKASVKTWIFAIALNLCRDRLRRQKKLKGQVSLNAPVLENQTGSPVLETIDSGSADPFSELNSSETIQLVNQQIQRLPEKLKFPFVYCILEEHTYDECATILKTNRKTVETRIYRARKVLRERLAKYF